MFLSYRSVDRLWVLGLYDVLKELDYEVFLDQVVLVGGSTRIPMVQKKMSMKLLCRLMSKATVTPAT